MKLHQLVALLLCLVLCFGILTACGESDTASTEGTPGSGNSDSFVETTKPLDTTDPTETEPQQVGTDPSKFTFKLSDDGTYYIVTRYIGNDTEIILPTEYEGLPVTTVESLLKFNSTVQSVIIPEGYVELGLSALDSEDLTSVSLPETLTTIGEYAFFGTALTSIDLPDSLKVIGRQAFVNCVALKQIDLPDGLLELGENAFSGSGLTSIEMPAGLKEVSRFTFSDCVDLVEAKVTTLTWKMFSGCTSLTTVSYVEGCFDEDFGISEPFEDCAALTNVTVPEGAKSIAQYTFSDVEKLTNITLPSTLTSIGSYAMHCEIESLFIPDSVTHIGEDPFGFGFIAKPVHLLFHAGSYAETYFTEHTASHITYEIVE